MSSQDYNKKVEECRKLLNALRQDIKYRGEQLKRGEATFSLDAEIRGQFIQIGDVLLRLEKMLALYIRTPKDFNLGQRDIDKRQSVYDQLVQQRNNLQRDYDNSLLLKEGGNAVAKPRLEALQQKYQNHKMTKEQLAQLKKKQELQQEEVIDDLLDTVKVIREGQGVITTELGNQDVLLNVLDTGMNENIRGMTKVRRKMVKLLENSSTCGLMLAIIAETAGIVCICLLWK